MKSKSNQSPSKFRAQKFNAIVFGESYNSLVFSVLTYIFHAHSKIETDSFHMFLPFDHNGWIISLRVIFRIFFLYFGHSNSLLFWTNCNRKLTNAHTHSAHAHIQFVVISNARSEKTQSCINMFTSSACGVHKHNMQTCIKCNKSINSAHTYTSTYLNIRNMVKLLCIN